MKNVLKNLNKRAKQIKGRIIKSKLPTGRTEFEAWIADIVDTYDLAGLADEDSLIFVIANVVLSLKPECAYVKKGEMANRVVKAASNQVCSYIFQEIKQRQADKQKAEATAQQSVVPDEQPKQ